MPCKTKIFEMFRDTIPASFPHAIEGFESKGDKEIKMYDSQPGSETKSPQQLESLAIKEERRKSHSSFKWPFCVPEFISANRSRWCAEKDPALVMPRILRIVLNAGVDALMVGTYIMDIRLSIDCLPVTMRLTMFETSYYAPFVGYPFLIECQKREGDWNRWYRFEEILTYCLPRDLFGDLVIRREGGEQTVRGLDLKDENCSVSLKRMLGYDLIRLECSVPSACGIRILLDSLPGPKNESLYALMRQVVRYPDEFIRVLFTGIWKERREFLEKNSKDESYVRIYNQLANVSLSERFVHAICGLLVPGRMNYWDLEELDCFWKIAVVCMKHARDRFMVVCKRVVNALQRHAQDLLSKSDDSVELEMKLQMTQVKKSATLFLFELE
jgi:hypothetical protein